jgi:biopolymer transport protein ExbD
MNLRRRHRVAPEVATASLNDIMFFLMLFFLITSTLVNPNVIKLLLPKASANKTLNKQPLTISVTKDFKYYINNKPVAYESLSSELASAIQGTSEPTAVLRVDRGITVQDLVNLLEIGTKLKIKMILATDATSK